MSLVDDRSKAEGETSIVDLICKWRNHDDMNSTSDGMMIIGMMMMTMMVKAGIRAYSCFLVDMDVGIHSDDDAVPDKNVQEVVYLWNDGIDRYITGTILARKTLHS